MSATRAERLTKWVIAGPPLAFLLVFFLLPALIMALASFRYPGEFGGLAPLAARPGAEGGLTFENYALFFGDWIYAQIFAKSLGIAALTTFVCMVMAYPLAMLIARSPEKRRDFMVLLVILPFASNLLVRVYAWMVILGPMDLLFSRFAVIVGMVYVHLPFMVLPLYTNLEKHDPALLDAAQDCGANAWQRFWQVTFPLSLPGIFSGAVLVFIPVLGMFAIPDILGGTRDMLIGNLIKDQFLVTRDWPFGSTLSIMLTLTVLLCVWAAARLGSTRGRYA
jgi:spermidine/putrescine transport system permease protein